jgi:hypothetical protein
MEERDRTIIKAVAAGAGCLVLVIGVGAFLISRVYFYMNGPRRMLDDHIRAINSGNYQLAYTHFTDDLKQDISYDEFRQNLEAFSSVLPGQESSFSHVKVVNDNASVEGTITGRDGAIFPVEYRLVRQNGVWRISMYHWTPPGERIRI